MRKCPALGALFPTVRGQLLAATLTRPEKWWYLSELARFVGTTPSTLQRELKALVAGGILEQRREGRRTYFRPEAGSPFFFELRGLLEKTAGLLPTLASALAPFRDIECAFVYGSVARGAERASSDVDLLVIGDIGVAELSGPLQKAEGQLGREIDVINYSPAEFRRTLKARDHFVSEVLEQPKEFVKGSQDDLDRAAGKLRRSTS